MLRWGAWLVLPAAIGCGRVAYDEASFTDAAARDAIPSSDAPVTSDAPPCTALFADDFDDGVRDPFWAEAFANPPSTLEETGGELVITLAEESAVSAHSGYQTAPLDFTRRSTTVRVTEAPRAATSAQAFLGVGHAEATLILVEEGLIHFRRATSPTMIENLVVLPYAPDTHRWWRIREIGGALSLETSSDGATWDAHVTIPAPDTTETRVQLAAGTYRSETAPGRARFDDFSIGCR